MKQLLILFSLCILSGENLLAQDFPSEFSFGVEQMSGHTTYQIGGNVSLPDGTSGRIHFPLSELKFPTNISVFTTDFILHFSSRSPLSIQATLQQGLTKDAGKMEDSDWGITSSDTSRLDIFSKSDAELSYNAYDINIRYHFSDEKALLLYLAYGYKQQTFDYEIFDLDQWQPSNPSAGHDRVSGKVLTYKITYKIPYVKFGFRRELDSWLIKGGGGISTAVNALDEDNHILRDKTSKSETKGQSQFFDFQIGYKLSKSRAFYLKGSWMNIKTDGDETQYDNGVESATIEHKNMSKQSQVGLHYSALF